MYTKEELYTSPDYWFTESQTELYNQVIEYMEREGINRSELSKQLNVSKGYITQILNGESNFSMRKLIEISLAIGLIPTIKYEKLSALLAPEEKVRIIPFHTLPLSPSKSLESHNNHSLSVTYETKQEYFESNSKQVYSLPY